jgi:type I restriction enzyme S subunit
MKDERNIAPVIRFDGFSDAWELRELNTLAEFNPTSNLPEKFEYVDLESVVGTELVGHRTENRDSAPSRAQRLAKKNDVFYQTVRPYQKNNYLFDLPYDNYVFSTGYAQMRPIGNGYFLLTLVQEAKFVNRVLERSTGTSYPAINSNELAKLPVKVPADIEEEQQVGTFFKSLDNTIALHQRKLDALKQIKKGFLQQMFPENREKVPRVRFTDFDEDWELRKLLDNIDKVLDYRGKSPTKFGMEWGNEGYLVLSALNVKNGYIDKSVEAKYGDKELFERWMGDYRLAKGDVLFTTEAPLGNVAQITDDEGYILNQRTVAFKSSKETDDNFFAQLLRSPIVQNTLSSNSSGGTAKGIGMKEFAKLNAYVPKLGEQQKIGSFFKQLDDTIALHQQKIDQLKILKKAYLQNMFI